MRSYERSHPWLKFQIDLRAAGPRFWLLMGEAQSKLQHLSGVPLLPAVQQQFQQLFLAKGVLATAAIEGNTLSEEQVLQHLEGKLRLPPSKEYLQQEIDNIVRACNEIGGRVLSGDSSRVSVDEIRHFNELVLKDLEVEEGVVPGQYAKDQRGVGRYRAAPVEDKTYLMDRLCQWLNDELDPPNDMVAYRAAFGALKAVLAHLYLAWIHAFGDGNGRTARLVEFKVLLAHGAPTVSAHLLSNHYNQTRAEYYRQLDRASASNAGAIPFVEYALTGFVDALREQIETVKQQQMRVHWINYIHERLQGSDPRTEVRRRKLAIALSRANDWARISDLRHLSPKLAEAYSGRTDQTVQRDVLHLAGLGLLLRKGDLVRANTGLMLAFLPPSTDRGTSSAEPAKR